MKNKGNILIVGNSHDKHLSRFVAGLRRHDQSVSIDMFDVSMIQYECAERNLYDDYYYVKRKFPDCFYKCPIINKLLKLFDLYKSYNGIKKHYSIINIQVPTLQSFILMRHFKKDSNYIITTPWGSDVYRISERDKKHLQKIYNESDFICVMRNTKFGDDVINKFSVPEEKCVELCFGSDILDKIINEDITKDEAKLGLLGTKDKFVIVCGYNASNMQNHIKIIDSLTFMKEELPANVIILLPMTYSKSEPYMQSVREKVKDSGFDYIIYENYLPDSDVVKMRLCADIFIHMQETDAYSSTLHEFIYSGAKVINARWLSYKELEIGGKPYFEADFSDLKEVLRLALSSNGLEASNTIKTTLESFSWSYQIQQWIDFFKRCNSL